MHLKSTFGICADIVWNILSPDSNTSTHSIHVWYIFIYIYHKNKPNVGKYIYHSHESHGSYGSGLITFQVFVVSGHFFFADHQDLRDAEGGGHRWHLWGSKSQKRSRLKATWDIIWIICILNKYKLIFIYIYIHIRLVLLIPRNRDIFFFDTSQISMAWNWEVGNDGR